MIVTVDQLKPGDEIIVPSNSYLRYFRVLKPVRPRLDRKTKQPIGTFKAVRVSTNIEEVTMTQTYGGRTRNWINKIYKCTPEGHNKEILIDLNYRSIWLTNRR